MSDRVVRFDDFELDRHTLELRRAGVPVRLQQQPARVLVVLIDHAGDLVTREQLRKAIWDDETFVDFDRGLNYCISQIRTALGPHYLETLRGRGYRFNFRSAVAEPPLSKTAAVPPHSKIAAVAAILVLLASLAAWKLLTRPDAIGVAPLTAPAAERQWAAALHAQIVSHLSIASKTPVIDLTQSSAAKTRWRVEGRVDRSAQQYRVTMLLRDMRDGSVPWSDIFAGTPGDWIDAQSEMAERMTEIIRYRIEGPSAGMPKRRQRLPQRATSL